MIGERLLPSETKRDLLAITTTGELRFRLHDFDLALSLLFELTVTLLETRLLSVLTYW